MTEAEAQELCRQIKDHLVYEDGYLYWKSGKQGRKKDKVIGAPNNTGYLQLCFSGKKYLNHRIVFLMHHGYMPEYVDHIDNNRNNNRIENLREATRSQNQWNRRVNKNSSTGVKNVYWNPQLKKYFAQLNVNKKSIYLGVFKELEDAKKALINFRKEHHGDFARN